MAYGSLALRRVSILKEIRTNPFSIIVLLQMERWKATTRRSGSAAIFCQCVRTSGRRQIEAPLENHWGHRHDDRFTPRIRHDGRFAPRTCSAIESVNEKSFTRLPTFGRRITARLYYSTSQCTATILEVIGFRIPLLPASA